MGVCCRADVYLKLQPVFLQKESDGAPAGQKVRSFADSQHVGALDDLQNLCVSLRLRMAHEKNVAGSQQLLIAQPANLQAAAANGNPPRILRQRCPEVEVPKDA